MQGVVIKKSHVCIVGTVWHWYELKIQYNYAVYCNSRILEELSAQGNYAKGAFVVFIIFPHCRSPPCPF
jgi:hypothetical protein